MKLKHLLYPKTVAVIGASRVPGKVGHEIMANLIHAGFDGRIVPVNPSASEVLGVECYSELARYTGPVDLSIIVVPVPQVLSAVKSSIQAGCKAVAIITAGFKEVGPEGAELEHEAVRLCAAKGVRLLGPNCLGLINAHHRMNASFATQMPDPGTISVISQSGALCTAILDWAVGRHLGLAKLVSLGNKADVNENDLLLELSEDRETKVIVGYLESIESGTEFVRAAEAASSVKPVVILKSAVTEVGRQAASSHTGSLAGADVAYGAAFKRSGVIRADHFDSLLDFATALAMQPLPKGDRVAIVTNAGGPGIMAADSVLQAGMKVATLGNGTATALRKKLPAAASVRNPIDVLGDAGPERYSAALSAALEDDSVDAVIVILTPQAMTRPADTATTLVRCLKGQKPVLAVFMGGRDLKPSRDQLLAAQLPDYDSPERAVAALRAMWEYALWKRRPARVITRFPVNRHRVRRILSRYLRTGQRQVGEADAKEILRAYDFSIPRGRWAATVDEAVDAAGRIGFPVAMKIVSPDIVHKSDLGGVKLNLATPDAVRDAFDLMMLRIHQLAPRARLQGVYVESMCAPGLEVIMGMSRDPQFGPMLMFGLGGIFVEVMKDVSFHLAPITADEAVQMLVGTKSYALLQGARGRPEVDIRAIATGLQRISQLVADFPVIAELDINPFIVGGVDIDPVVADARMTLAPGIGKL